MSYRNYLGWTPLSQHQVSICLELLSLLLLLSIQSQEILLLAGPEMAQGHGEPETKSDPGRISNLYKSLMFLTGEDVFWTNLHPI